MNIKLKDLTAELDLCMSADRHNLWRRLQQLQQGKSEDVEGAERAIAGSKAKRQLRQDNLPAIAYPEELPVSARRDEIGELIGKHQVVIVAGETGSGKTTQLPKICLAAGRGVKGLIGHTQPRRIAARSVASRIAEELKTELGQAVGYKVRFSDQSRPESYIKLMTDGILLAESQTDRFLNQYDTLIIDEAHERSLNIDFLLGYLKQLLPKRRDLKLIITSATIDTDRFSKHFAGAPVVEVSGRTHPVDMRYRPLLAEDEDAQDRDLQQAILDAVDEASRHGQGDMLIFLPGEREIRETAESLRKHHPPHTEVLPLYARLSAAEQNKVFQSHRGRRIVLTTNVAETSLTVPGIRYVIDPGLARMSRYSHRTKVQRLPIEKVSQASANQRAGRCGRIGPGVCFRLYDEADFLSRPEFTDPEIKRSNLAAVILQMKALKLGDVEDFPFVEAPDSRMITDGYKLLEELGAVNKDKKLTKTGQQLAKLPLDPRVARMILAAKDEGSMKEVLIIASALSVQDPRERPTDKQQAADEKHRQFKDELSDFLAYVNLWQAYHEQKPHLTQSKLRKWCKENFLSYLRMRDWHDVHSQLLSLVKDMGWKPKRQEADYASIHKALLAGLLGNIANKAETKEQEYVGARATKLALFPGSVLHKKKPKWVMAAELVETSKLFARISAKIEPEWIEEVGGDLVRRNYYDPHWEKKPAAVIAFERTTLYGLMLNPKRRVNYGAINPVESREIFIRQALVAGELRSHAGFYRHNLDLVAEIEDIEAKARRRDVLVDEQVIYDFYDQRLPPDSYDGRRLEHWAKKLDKAAHKTLYLDRDELMRQGAGGVTDAQFPDELALDGLQLSLSYCFEPADEDDGVTVTIPLPALNLLSPQRFEWLVPGLLHDKLIFLIKSLPKQLRRNFVPAPNFADACLGALAFGQDSLINSLAHQLLRMTGVKVPADAWDVDKLPNHLRMNFNIIDEKGKSLAKGRDLLALQRDMSGQAQQSFASVPAWEGERTEVTTQSFGELPQSVQFERNGVSMKGFPALVEHDNKVALTLCDTPVMAEQQSRVALRALIASEAKDKVKYLQKNLPKIDKICLYYAPIGRCDEIKRQLVAKVIDMAFLEGDLPRTQAEFDGCLQQGRSRLVDMANELGELVFRIMEQYNQIAKSLKGNIPPTWLQAMADIKQQLAALMNQQFVLDTPIDWLREYPRYLLAINKRLEKLGGAMGRDRAAVLEIEPLWRFYEQRKKAQLNIQQVDAELIEFRWLLEELRVSLFAQELKTKRPISVKRLKDKMKQITAG